MTFFKRSTRALLIVGVVAAMAAPVTADAATRERKTGCGGRWDAAATCNFRYAGGGLSMKADFTTADEAGYVSILLEAVDAETGQRYPLLSCGSVSTDFGGCASVSTGSPTVEIERGQKLICAVQGADRGRYSCSSTSK
jgi:hypothetical protein